MPIGGYQRSASDVGNREDFYARPRSGRPAAERVSPSGNGSEVSRVGDAVLLEPITQKAPFDSEAFWAKIAALSGGADFPEITEDDLRPELDDEVDFDARERCISS